MSTAIAKLEKLASLKTKSDLHEILKNNNIAYKNGDNKVYEYG